MEIPSGLYDLYHDGIDTVIGFAGKACKLVFPALETECPNCYYDNNSRSSAGVYKSGGPISFSFGMCPYCQGVGVIYTETTDNINLIIHWNLQEWISINKNTVIPAGAIETFGYMSDYPRIMNAQYLRVSNDIAGYQTFNFKRYGPATPHGFKHRYLICTWERA